MNGTAVTPSCPLCVADGETVWWRDRRLRVVAVEDAEYPGFLRVIWNDHVREMSDLDAAERVHFMDVVFAVETAVRQVMAPDKINLASFGNVVPHVHWHVIARYADDAHFPNPVWGPRRRDPDLTHPAHLAHLAALRALLPELHRIVVEILQRPGRPVTSS